MPRIYKSLNLSNLKKLPLWHSIPILFFLIVIGILIGEIIGRTSLQYYLPPPSVGVDSFDFDTKVAYLERQIQEHGELDCLIVGDSMANNGLNPTLIEATYESKTKSPLHCFNVGMPALTLDASGPVAEALANRFQPRLLVFILSPRDFVPKYGKPYRHIASSEWVRQNLGELSLKGWATNRSYSYRYLLAFQYWLTPTNRDKIIEASKSISATGYTPLYGYRTPNQAYITQPDYKFNNTDAIKGLENLLQIHEKGISVLVIDAPIQSYYYPIYLESPENYEQIYISPLEDTLTPLGIPFWLTDQLSLKIPNDAWHDPMHVNETGVPFFSTWLGERLAENYPPVFFK